MTVAVMLAAVGTCRTVEAQVFSNPLRPSRSTDVPCVLDKCLNGSGGATTGGSPQVGTSPEGGPIRQGDPGAGAAPTSDSEPGRGGSFGRRMGGARAPGTFDFYVLALSWSPGFCDTGGDAKAPRQCAEGANLGFVVHGLWPQYTRGFPSDCDSAAGNPSRTALESVTGLYPDVGLARYEWRKHGTCTGLSPTDYFAAVRRAREAVTIPDSLSKLSEPQTVVPLDVVRAFAASNPGLRADMMAVTCRQEELEEVRICFTKDLRGFVTCPEVSRASCRTRQITVMPAR